MNPEDRDYGAGAEAAHQADTIHKQMDAEALADAPKEAPVDNSILAGIEADEDMKSLSDIIHEGATQPDSNPTDFAAESAQKAPKEKKPFNFKPILIAIVALVILGGAGFGIFMLISAGGSESGGAKADPERLAFFVEGDDGNASYAIYNDKGEKLTDAVYEKVSDFNASGYAVAKKNGSDKVGIIANTGKLSIPYDKYTSIEAFGNYFIASNDEGTILIDGTGEKIMNAEYTESKHNLYSVFDGAQSTVYDAKGEKVGESKVKKPISEAATSAHSFCLHVGSTYRCFETETGKKLNEFESDKDLTFVGAISGSSNNHQCMLFKNVEKESERYLYYYGTVTPYDAGAFGSIIPTEYSSGNCFFTDATDFAIAGDAKKINFKEIGISTPASLVIHDSTHYGYYYEKDDNYYFVIHMGDDEIEIKAGRFMPRIYGDNKIIVIQYESYLGNSTYDGHFTIFTDSTKPIFEYKYDKGDIISARTTGIDENKNIAAGRSIINVDKGIIYTYKESGYIGKKGDIYVVSEKTDDTGQYITAVSKTGKELIVSGAYNYIELSDDYKFIIGKHGNDYTLHDLEGKELLKNYEGFRIYDTHIEALKDGKTEYYTRDMKKVK